MVLSKLLALPEREARLRMKVLELTAEKERPGAEASTSAADPLQQQSIQEGIYQETGLLASSHFSLDDLEYLRTRLPPATREMLRLLGRDRADLLIMYDLRHSLISCQGGDAAVKIRKAEKLTQVVLSKIEERLVEAQRQGKADAEVEPVRLLELGSGLSDVTSMVWELVRRGLGQMEVAGGRDPLSLFHITNCEYEAHTGTTASQLLLKAGRTNVAVRYGPELGDATRLAGLADQSFDVVWSSLFLGAFAVVDAGEGRKDAPMARAVIEQAWRVARHGAVVMHTDFSYLAGPPDSLDFPWAPQKQGNAASVDTTSSFAAAFAKGRQAPPRRFLRRANTAPACPPYHLGGLNPWGQLTLDFVNHCTQKDFDYWAWFDGGDFAAKEVREGAGTRYSAIKVKRYAGKAQSQARRLLAEVLLFQYRPRPQEALSYEDLLTYESHCKARYVCFTMTTAVVNKPQGPVARAQ